MKPIFPILLAVLCGLLLPGPVPTTASAENHPARRVGPSPALSGATAPAARPSLDDAAVVKLDGEWQLTGWSPDRSRQVTLTARVPGQVHADLRREGLIPDPFWRDNAEQCQWPEHWEWRYKRSFRLPPGFGDGRVRLEFDGLDTYAEITLNGRRIGPLERPTTCDMFLEYAFDVTGWLKPDGENVLEVRFLPIERVVGEKVRQQVFPAAFGDPYRAYVRRMQCTFGWDWVHRFVTAGIWRSCRLAACPAARVEHPFVYTRKLLDGGALLHVEAEIAADSAFRGTVRGVLRAPDGGIAWSEEWPVAGGGKVAADPVIRSPRLWWPHGSGAQPLYTLDMAVYDPDGRRLHGVETRTGIRTVEIEQLPEAGGRTFTFRINGERIFARGGNWIPADPFPSQVTPERYAMLVGRAAEAGMNMLRVWGGGIYEQEPFLAACDSLGVMLWHDFMLACGGYPEHQPGFSDLFLEEVECNVRRMRNHPSVVVWCGDNELGMGYAEDADWPFKATHRDRTAPLLARIDPSRPFRPTSPYGGGGAGSPRSGDAHQGAQYSDSLIGSPDAADYRALTARYARAPFLSESTTAGVPTRRSLLRFMTEADLDRSEMFDYHTKDNPYVGGGLTLFGKLENLSEKLYGPHCGEQCRRLRQMEYTQYEFVRLTLEAARARKFSSSGVLFWMFNDCWPASGWSLVDYWGDPKAGWYAMKSGCREVIAATEQGERELTWWIVNDGMQPAEVAYKVWLQPLAGGAGRVIAEGVTQVGANGLRCVGRELREAVAREAGRDRIAVFEVCAGGGVDRSYWTPLLPREVDYPPTVVETSGFRPGTAGEIRMTSSRWGRVVTLEGDALFEDNYFEMLPGESRTIRWRSIDGRRVKAIRVSAWNAR